MMKTRSNTRSNASTSSHQSLELNNGHDETNVEETQSSSEHAEIEPTEQQNISTGEEVEHSSSTVTNVETEGGQTIVKVKVDGVEIPMTTQEFLRFRKEEKEIELERLKFEREYEIEKLKVEANSERGSASDNFSGEGRKFERYNQKLTNQKDPEEYFTAFEHFARREGWEKQTWVRRISQSIEGKALAAMNAIMTDTDSLDYDQLKAAILETFQLSPESYRQKFRSMTKQDNENIKTFILRLARTYNFWVKYSDIQIESDDAKKLSQLMIREEILQKVPFDMKKHLLQSKILDTAQLASEAEEFASLDANYWQKKNNQKNNSKGGKKRPHDHNNGKTSQDKDKQNKTQSQSHSNGNGQKFQNRGQPFKKFKTNQNSNRDTRNNHSQNQVQDQGHRPKQNSINRCAQIPSDSSVSKQSNKFVIPGSVQGKSIELFRDSGCDKTAVHSRFVPAHCYTGKSEEVKGINGLIHVPIAKVHIDCGRFVGETEVLVVDNMDHHVLLGTDIDSWDDLKVQKEFEAPNILVMTRAQRQQKVQEEILAQDCMRNYVPDKENQDVMDVSHCETNSSIVDADVQALLSGDVAELIRLQNEDPTLQGIRASIIQSVDHKEFYKHDNGIIMRKCQSDTRLRKQVGDQIVVPKRYRMHIMEIAHDKTGHLGIQKTKDRITQHFYWPNINHDVKQHCQTCEQCQFQTKGKQAQRLLLRPLPIVDTPFKRVGIDIKGPLPVTEQGNKHVLVVCDYATRYPEAIPIPDQRTDTVAQAMLEIFSRTGLPTEIIHDRGTQFMSKVMNIMCHRLGIQQLPATAYHQQTNGLTERFIGTLTSMISTLDQEDMENWDKQLPLFLFSYREVPSDFTGYSPFHLMYGRQIRGPLDLIKEGFLGESDERDIPSRLLEMSSNMIMWMADAKTRKVQKQAKMKENYDKKAKEREFRKGDRVLVFLPEGGGKLESKWQGPYTVERKVGEVNYEITMPDRKKSQRLLHANLIKLYYDREQAKHVNHCYCITGSFHEVYDESIDLSDEIDTQYLEENIGPTYTQTQTWKDAKIDEKLPQKQVDEIHNVMAKHDEAFSDVPGKTHVTSHKVVTTTETPIRQRGYRTPQAIKEKVQHEINNMLELGVIEEVNSAYASPIVAVTKPNGDIRLCTNYKALNKITVTDPYEMPRIDEILDDVAHAKFISTLDLTKGFYQVPLDPDAKAKSAFIAFGNQYAYNFMPFGMVNSSATFQRLVDEVLRDCKGFCRQYIDDVAIYSNSWTEHLEHVDIVLTKLQKAGLTIKPSKCKFACQEVTYLGHTIGNGEIKPNFEKVKAVEQFPRPVTKKNVRSFLGLTGYYRKFVHNYEDIARPLIDLTKKKQPNLVIWTQQCETAFANLKSYLSTEPILKAPDFGKRFLLQTDASKTGIGAVLSQLDDKLREHPVVYLSRQLKPNERNYSVSEQECLAIVWSINKLRYYLLGRAFSVITDHKALQWLDKTKLANSRLMRWSLILQEYNFDIQYRKGITNTNADSLSRICTASNN